jgi:membrane-associated protease RseP (regulator of RpoE activity)
MMMPLTRMQTTPTMDMRTHHSPVGRIVDIRNLVPVEAPDHVACLDLAVQHGVPVILHRRNHGTLQVQRWPESKPALSERQRKVGVELASTPGENGQPVVTVASVDATGTAADSGIQKGDIIVEIQQTLVSDPDQAARLFWARSSQGHHFAAVLVERDKKFLWIPVAIPN